MKIIISPAKKMNTNRDTIPDSTTPVFIKEAEGLWGKLNTMSYKELKELWKCNEKIASLGFERLQTLNMNEKLTPAILAYEGIQYQYMAPVVFSGDAWESAGEQLRILSGLYGILKPSDGVIPYRLEMQAGLANESGKDLYQFWGDKIYKELAADTDVILNLASKEYSKVIEPYLDGRIRYVTCIFGEKQQDGKIKVKGTLAKMARGEMVKWICEQNVQDPEQVKAFTGLGYRFSDIDSGENEFVFLLEQQEE